MCHVFGASLVFNKDMIAKFELTFRSLFYVLLKILLHLQRLFFCFPILQCQCFLLLIPLWVFGALFISVIDKFKELISWIYFFFLISNGSFIKGTRGATQVHQDYTRDILDTFKESFFFFFFFFNYFTSFKWLFFFFFYLLSVLTLLFTYVLYRKILNGMSGKLQFCRSAMLLKTSTDGLVGMILPHLYAMHVLKSDWSRNVRIVVHSIQHNVIWKI
jgi:hypothetical protein